MNLDGLLWASFFAHLLLTRCASRGSDALAERSLSHRSPQDIIAISSQKCVPDPREKSRLSKMLAFVGLPCYTTSTAA
jgi:hypothetical protein